MAKEKKISDLEDLPGIGGVSAAKLRSAGIDSLEKVATTPPHELAEMGGISAETAKKAVQAAQECTTIDYETGSAMFERRAAIGKISTNSNDLDEMIGGGIESGAITEAYGRFASGKTQLGFQLCVNAQLPKDKGGMDGTVLFIDTEATFRPERIREIAEAKGLDPEKTLDSVFYVRAQNTNQQILTVERADKLIQEKNVKLIVVDSMMALFRAEFVGRGALGERQGKLNMHIHRLQALADKHELAVYVTNQVMDNPGILFGDPTTPIGGNIMAHAATTRLYMRKSKEDKRIVRLIDSPNMPEGECVIRLTPSGIKG